MNFFKPTVKFVNTMPGVEKVMPIIPAKNIRHPWVQRAVDDVVRARAHPEFGMNKAIFTARCPGIFGFMRHGWVMRAWQDFVIETNGSLDSFTWRTPISQNAAYEKGEYIESHPTHQLADYMDNWPANTMRVVVKINSGWRCEVPRGYYLMETAVAYADESRFTTLNGFFSKEKGIAHVNPQLLWHVTNGKTLVKAGTPLSQYLLVPKTQFDMVVESTGQSSSFEVDDLLSKSRFVADYSKIKEFYK